MSSQVIDIQDFMSRLKSEGLIIVPKDEYMASAKVNALQKKYLKRRALTIQEILNAEFWPVTSRNSIVNWIKSGKIRVNEHYQSSAGTVMILTTAVQRLAL